MLVNGKITIRRGNIGIGSIIFFLFAAGGQSVGLISPVLQQSPDIAPVVGLTESSPYNAAVASPLFFDLLIPFVAAYLTDPGYIADRSPGIDFFFTASRPKLI